MVEMLSCPRNGTWITWSDWSGCSTTCGTGTILRTRHCYMQTSRSEPCVGKSLETLLCNSTACPGESYRNINSNRT